MEQRIRAHGRAILTIGGGLLLAATLGAGVVFATAGGATSAPAGTSFVSANTVAAITAPVAGPGPRLVLRGIVRRTVSADLTLKTKTGFRTIRYERGEVTAVGGASVTVQTANGVSTTFAVVGQTRLRAQGKPTTLLQVHAGDRAMVFATEQDGSFTAYLVRFFQPAATSAPTAPAAPTVAPGNS